ncbi:hypothetical protein DRN97_02235, partial [Methanosarcinales archaeon]
MKDYPIFIGSDIRVKGITERIDSNSQTTKKIWLDAKRRAIEDNSVNRSIAYSIDSLARLIIKVETFSILGDYEIHSNDDEKHAELIAKIKQFIDDIALMKLFRQSFPSVKVHGRIFFQKIYENEKIRTVGKPRKLKTLQQLPSVQKFVNPFDQSDFYLYQNIEIKSDWRNPNDHRTK